MKTHPPTTILGLAAWGRGRSEVGPGRPVNRPLICAPAPGMVPESEATTPPAAAADDVERVVEQIVGSRVVAEGECIWKNARWQFYTRQLAVLAEGPCFCTTLCCESRMIRSRVS